SVRLVEVLDEPAEDGGERLAVPRHVERRLDVLPLAAVAVRGHDHAAGDGVRDAAPVLDADDVQAGIDARGGTGAGDEPAVPYVEDVGVDEGGRAALGELVGVPPVRRAAPAVEQARLLEDEDASADAHDPGPAVHRPTQGR